MSNDTHALSGDGSREDGEMSAPVVKDAASSADGLGEIFTFESQLSQSQVAAGDDGARKAGSAAEPSAPATLQEAARALMNV